MIEAIEKKQLNNIATWMVPIRQTRLPSSLTGVFFMDGNPLPDTCITLYNVGWEEENLTLFLPVTAPLQWTFHDSIPGWMLLRSAQLFRFKYKIQFDDKALLNGQITPFLLGLPVPKWIVNATMYRGEVFDNGDTWKRKNLWFGGKLRIGEYVLRRVVDEEGRYTPAFDYMLAQVQSACLVVARTSATVNPTDAELTCQSASEAA
jgi:hypothetical protein